MTHSEVREVVRRLYPPLGDRKMPTKMFEEESIAYEGNDQVYDQWTLFMNAEGWGYPTCEAIVMNMKDGRVVRMMYSPD